MNVLRMAQVWLSLFSDLLNWQAYDNLLLFSSNAPIFEWVKLSVK